MVRKPAFGWVLVAVVTLGSLVQGVEPGRPSRTAIMAAIFRAIGAKNPDAEFRNPDFLAAKFLRPHDIALLAASGADYRAQLSLQGDALAKYLSGSLAVTTNFVRTRHMDATLEDAIASGTGQVVILGAGLDSRGYRFAEQLHGKRLFEVDFPPTQEYKKRRVREVVGRLPREVRFVGMDFTKDDLLTQLRKSGYDDRQRSVFIWEGVVHYIPESAVRATLRFVALHAAPGSRIVFDYPFASNARINNPDNIFSRWGEPFLFGFPDGGPASFVRDAGLELVSDLSNEELVHKYAMRSDGTSSLRLPPPGGNRTADDAGIATAQVPRR